MSKLKTGTKDANGEIITLEKSEAAAIYAQVNRSRLRLLKRLDNLDLVGDTQASEADKSDPPEIQLLLELNRTRREATTGEEAAAVSKVMLVALKDVRGEANRASAELQKALLAEPKKSDIPTMATIMQAAKESAQ